MEARDVCVDAVRVAEQDSRIAERLRFAFVRLALAQLIGDELILRLLKLGGGHGRVLQLFDLGGERALALVGLLATGEDGESDEEARIFAQVCERVDALRELLLIDERLVEPRRFAGRKERVGDAERVCVRAGLRRNQI